MVAETLPIPIFLEIEVVGPGGTASSDVRCLGVAGSFRPPRITIDVAATHELVVDLANDNPSKAYRVTDALVVPDPDAGDDDEPVLSDVRATGDIAAGQTDAKASVVLHPLSSVRGKKVGKYKLQIVVDDAA